MRAVVLVGGLGTRLRPLTLHRPKQLLPVVDRSMLEWVLGNVAAHGVDEVVLSLGYKPDAFTDALPEGRCAGVGVRFAVDPWPLDTAGAIRFAATEIGIDERFCVINGDVITDLDVGALVRFHDESGAEGTVALHKVDDPSRFGVLPTDESGRVSAFVEKPAPGTAPTDLINAGYYVFEPSVLERIAPDRAVSVERETFPAMVTDGSLYALDDGGAYWVDTGTPQAYVEVNLDVVDGVLGDGSAVAVAGDAKTATTAIVQHSVVRTGAVIDDGATVIDSIVLDGAHVEADAVVRRSIVGEGATIGAGAEITGYSVIGDDAVVAPRSVLTAARVPDEDDRP